MVTSRDLKCKGVALTTKMLTCFRQFHWHIKSVGRNEGQRSKEEEEDFSRLTTSAKYSR